MKKYFVSVSLCVMLVAAAVSAVASEGGISRGKWMANGAAKCYDFDTAHALEETNRQSGNQQPDSLGGPGYICYRNNEAMNLEQTYYDKVNEAFKAENGVTITKALENLSKGAIDAQKKGDQNLAQALRMVANGLLLLQEFNHRR